MKYLLLYVVIFCFVTVNTPGQIVPKGSPFVTNYIPPGNSALRNWAVVSDTRGIIYFANDEGKIIEYDGFNWRDIPMPNHLFTRSLGISDKGRIYVGAVGEFGYLLPDIQGNQTYRSLRSKADTTELGTQDIWKILVKKSEILFCAYKKIFNYFPDTDSLISIDPGSQGFNNCRFSFLVNDRVFIADLEYGLLELNQGKISRITGGYKFHGKFITSILPYSDNELFIGAFNDSLYIFNTETGKTNPLTINKEVCKMIRESGLYHSVQIYNDSYLLATTNKYGALLIDKKGRIIDHINKADGIADDQISYIYTNPSSPLQYPLWLTSLSGISKVETNSPLTIMTDASGLEGSIHDIKRFNGDLYVATSKGVYRMLENGYGQAEFAKVEKINYYTWSLLPFYSENHNHNVLLAGTDYGIIEIDPPGEVTRIDSRYDDKDFSSAQTFKLIKSRYIPETFYACCDGQLIKFRFEGEWKITGRIKTSDLILSIAEIDTNTLLITGLSSGITKFSINNNDTVVKKLEMGKVISSEDNIAIQNIDDEYYFCTRSGLYRYDDVKETLVPCNLFSSRFTDPSSNIFTINKDNDGEYWITGSDKNSKTFMCLVSFNNGSPVIYDTIFNRLSALSTDIVYPDINGNVWFNKENVLYRYDKNFHKDFTIPYFTLIREASIGKDSVIFKGTNYKQDTTGQLFTSLEQPDALKPVVNYKFNIFTFKWSAAFFEKEEETQFRFRLNGFEEAWSNWSGRHEFTYTNLAKGNYIFTVQAKNIYGVLSEPATYEFTIMPPWYTTIYAYFGYVIIFILTVYILVRLNTIRLKRENIRLENIVTERTAEVNAQKKVIEEKNRKITESIHYSKHIQDSILIKQDEIDKIIPGSFVYLRPRDIVSGDFYWFARQGDYSVITAVDCTGHGVPGAFMCMIGNTLLNFIVKEKGIVKPSEILNNLNSEVIKVLQQERKDTLSQDGMDISVITIDPKNGTMQYAGAKNPLYMVINNDLNIIEADPFSIGGTHLSRKNRRQVEFKNQEVKLIPGSSVYLFTDGYADQFGGPDNKSYNTTRFGELIKSISKLQCAEQYRILDSTINEWMKSARQIDDMLVIGIKL
jgi:serine phosphatase RsbU (regulator of sigma subunit)/ligand-binding sensor domain-containing protein